MCKRGDAFSRPVLIGRGLGLDTQFRENKDIPIKGIVHRYGVLRGRWSLAHVDSDAIGSTQERALSFQIERYIFLVVMAAGIHPFPFRTRKLSLPAPMVLGGRPPGRVGRRQNFSEGAPFARWTEILDPSEQRGLPNFAGKVIGPLATGLGPLRP